MSDWQPDLYMRFGKERTQPSIDLTMKIAHDGPKRIIDIGCGPGNSTQVLRSRWPEAGIIGLDFSPTMIAQAKETYPETQWLCADASGDLSRLGGFDVVFSNAAIQWMPDQGTLLAKLFGMLNENGVLAVQVPCTKDMPVQTELMKLTSGEKWRRSFSDLADGYSKHEAEYYYDILCGLTREVELWETRYFHIMNTHADIVKWYSGTGLRIYLDCLKDDTVSADFLRDYETALKDVYPIQVDGRILFPFTRIFFTARNLT